MGVMETEHLSLEDGKGVDEIKDDTPEEDVSVEWVGEEEEEEEEKEDDSATFFWGSSGVPVGVLQASSDSEWLNSHDETLAESVLSPELPPGVDLGCSLMGVLWAITSEPRNRRLNLFTMLFRDFGDVVLVSAAASTSRERL